MTDATFGIILTAIVIAYIMLLGIVAWAAEQRGRNQTAFVFLGIFFSPLFALLALAAAGDKKPRQQNQ